MRWACRWGRFGRHLRWFGWPKSGCRVLLLWELEVFIRFCFSNSLACIPRSLIDLLLLIFLPRPLVARRRLTFLAHARKVSKRSVPCCPRPCASLRATSVLAPRVVSQNSLRGWRRCVQTAAASQTTKAMCPSAHRPTLRAARRGGGRRDLPKQPQCFLFTSSNKKSYPH